MLYFLTALPQPSFVGPVGSPGAQYAEQHRRPADGDAPASAADANSSFFTYDDEDSRCAPPFKHPRPVMVYTYK